MKEIDQRAQLAEFESFLNDLETLELDKTHKVVTEYIEDKITALTEVDRGDLEMHRDMAKQRGYQHVGDEKVVNKLSNPSIGLDRDAVVNKTPSKGEPIPQRGELIRHNGMDYVVTKANGYVLSLVRREDAKSPTAKVKKLVVSPEAMKQNKRTMKAFPQRSGRNAWMVREKPTSF